MAENSDLSDSSSYNVSYNSTPMETEEIHIVQQRPSELLKKLNPQYPSRLYHRILKTKDISNVVAGLLSEYDIDRDRFIFTLIQLFIDISAYQYIDVQNFVKYNDLKNLVDYMEKSKNSILMTTGKYIVKMPIHSAKCESIGKFLESFIMLSAKEKILYDTSLNIIFQIVENMSASKLRPIKHTGVFIALKLQSGLIRVSFMIGQKMETYRHSLENEKNPKERKSLEHKIEKFSCYNNSVNKLIEFIHMNIFQKHWNHTDSQLHFMRKDCIMEVANWIEIFPDRFLFNNCLDFLISANVDYHIMVRLTAINLLHNILQKYHLKIPPKKLLKIILEISKRMKDVNYGIAVRAVEILTSINKFMKLSHTIRDDICILIYSSYYPLAAAAGKFLIQRINYYLTETNDKEECLKMLIFFEKKSIQKGIINKYPLVIETIIDSYPVLQDISVYESILEKSKIDDESLSIMINILTESVYQTYTGKCSLVRSKQITRKVDPEKVEKITKDLISLIDKMTDIIYPLDKLSKLLILVRNYGMKANNFVGRTTRSSN